MSDSEENVEAATTTAASIDRIEMVPTKGGGGGGSSSSSNSNSNDKADDAQEEPQQAQAAAAAVALKTNSVMLVPEGSPDVLRFEALAQSGKGEEGGSMPQANLRATEEPFALTLTSHPGKAVVMRAAKDGGDVSLGGWQRFELTIGDREIAPLEATCVVVPSNIVTAAATAVSSSSFVVGDGKWRCKFPVAPEVKAARENGDGGDEGTTFDNKNNNDADTTIAVRVSVSATCMPWSPALILVTRGSEGQCVFEEAGKLKTGETAPLTLRSHPGKGLGESRSGKTKTHWREFIECEACSASDAATVRLEDGNFVMATTNDLAFDVFHSRKIQAGNRVKFSSDETKTKEQGGRYDWIVNDGDGTIGLTEHPDLVLGLTPRLFPSDGVVDCALEVSKSLFDEGSPLVLTTGRIPICLGEEKLFAGRRRYFAFHEDGSMSPLDAPHLRLGVRDSNSETEWESDGKKHRVVAPYLCLVGAAAFARLTCTCESALLFLQVLASLQRLHWRRW